ncbi:protein of unknown function [Micromonospora pattaloongensis]|uniref:DUF397 domain-containing protein n=1 Tax=Micromonospora pattaloongensis TaxID=405436 RepID=A0A1H3HI30_9ACTN|nr:DUF397 domain-containing protein [Micromonospora pattaloongensis]SDY15203.1 protein of unknown function [Micromonospora pattaloongensis]
MTWIKSSRSSGNGQCVEVADLAAEGIGVRDSKDTSKAALVFDGKSWAAFITSVKAGRLTEHLPPGL